MFVGFTQLEASLVIDVLARNSSLSPVNLDALPTYRLYGPSGLMDSGTGTCTLKESGSVTGATNASPIVVTSASHGLTTGTRVTIASVLGNTGANGTHTITLVDTNSFSLDGSAGTGAYTSGGTWNTTGMYTLTVSALAAQGYEAGVTYTVLVSGALSATAWADLHTFLVG